jgi:hypothetical protein
MLTEAERRQLAQHILRDLPPAEFENLLKETLRRDPARLTDSAVYADIIDAVIGSAERDQWMANLLSALAFEHPHEGAGAFAGQLAQQRLGQDGLQSMLGGLMFDFEIFEFRFPVIRRHVCLIEIDRVFSGTGLLVGPDLVLTAEHVVNRLIGQDGRALAGSDGLIDFVFDFGSTLTEDGRRRPNKVIRVPAAPEWLLSHSPVYPTEPAKVGPPDDAQVTELDYALVRLAEPVGGGERKWTALKKVYRPLVPFQPISISQHPGGQSLKASFGLITCIPPHKARVRYTADTAISSSGSPCWDKNMELIAVHNFGGYTTPNGRQNQGVPIDRILGDIRGKLGDHALPDRPAVAPDPAPPPPPPAAPGAGAPAPAAAVDRIVASTRLVWNLGAEYPVLDRTGLQEAIAALVRQEGSQLLLIQGGRGTGRTFSMRVIQHYLRQHGHLAVEVQAANLIDKSATEVIDELRALLALKPLEPTPGSDLTTRPAQMTRFLLAEFFSQLKEKFGTAGNGEARASQVWLLFDSLDQFRLSDETHQLIAEMAGRLAGADMLRLVLIGYDRPLPADVEASAEKERIGEIMQTDVEAHLRYACLKHGVSMPDEDIAELARRAMVSSGAPVGPGLQRLALAVQSFARSLRQP